MNSSISVTASDLSHMCRKSILVLNKQNPSLDNTRNIKHLDLKKPLPYLKNNSLTELKKPDQKRNKIRQLTLSNALNGPVSKISFTDFFSENMMRDFIKFGKLHAIGEFTMSKISKPARQNFIPNILMFGDSKNKAILRKRNLKNKSIAPLKSKANILNDNVDEIIGICENTRVQNNRLKKDIRNSSIVLKEKFSSLINYSLS